MTIMHYFLGFPPYRTGGLTTFAYDLMLTQIDQGDEVIAAWPGRIKLCSDKVQIIKRKSINKIESYEIINPLPISYDEGISKVEAFIRPCKKSVFVEFFKYIKPDVIHFHTFMGLYKEFIVAAKECGIRTVFTTHDFFPICPKVTLYRNGKICEGNCSNCPSCNTTALSMTKIYLLQAPIYRLLKDSPITKKLRKNHRNNFYNKNDNKVSNVGIDEYIKLRQYYGSIYSLIDIIHFNSSVSKNIYERFLKAKKSIIIPITHRNIQDNKRKKIFHKDLRISYLGPGGGAKGFFLLKEALDELWNERQDFLLNVYFDPVELSPYMKVKERYNYKQLGEVFEDTDILIVPSIWYETFGYTVIESMSYGTPVIVSDTVGAKDVISDGCGIIIKNINSAKIIDTINSLNMEILEKMNVNIIERQHILTNDQMYLDIKQKCYMN